MPAHTHTHTHTHTHRHRPARYDANGADLVKMLLEKVGFKGTFEGGEGFGMSNVKREGVPLCSCAEGEGTFTIGFSADARNTEKAMVRG